MATEQRLDEGLLDSGLNTATDNEIPQRLMLPQLARILSTLIEGDISGEAVCMSFLVGLKMGLRYPEYSMALFDGADPLMEITFRLVDLTADAAVSANPIEGPIGSYTQQEEE